MRPQIYAIVIGVVSAASMAVEIVAGRALAPYVGMSLYSWTMIIAVVLTGLSLGHWIGGALADRTARPGLWVAGALLAAGATTLASIGVLSGLAPHMAGADLIPHVGILSLAAFFTPSLFAGVISPILTRMALAEAPLERQGRVLGLVFALGAGGAIVGTLVAGLALIPWLGVSAAMAAIAALYAVLALPFLASGRARWVGALGAAAALAAGLGLTKTPCDRESAYYCIQVDPLPGGARLMALDHLAHGMNVRDRPAWLLSPYLQGIDELVRRRFPGPELDAFFIGGGAFTLPRAWLARYQKGRLTAAEIDPVVTETAEQEMWLPKAERLEILHEDARRALTRLPPERRYDVVFGDAFKDISVPAHLVTDSFNSLIKSRLRPDGVYVANIIDLLRAPRFALSFAQTLQQQFEVVELWIDIAAVQPFERRVTWIVLASDTPSGIDRLTSTDGPARQWARVSVEDMAATLPEDALALLTDDYAPVERLLGALIWRAEHSE